MKRIIIFCLIAITFSCANNTPELLGTWKVVSNYYKGTFEILEQNDSIKAKVLYYNDDTTIIRASDKKEYYVFENLIAKNHVYVDAISGATKTKDAKANISIKPINKDTLEVTTYIYNRPLKELWVRTSK